MKTGTGIKLAHGFEIVEITPERDVWLEKKTKRLAQVKVVGNGKPRVTEFWKDLNDEQKKPTFNLLLGEMR